MSSVLKIINEISHESQLFLVAIIAYLLFSKDLFFFVIYNLANTVNLKCRVNSYHLCKNYL